MFKKIGTIIALFFMALVTLGFKYDPTRPYAITGASGSLTSGEEDSINLQGIFNEKGNKTAVINGKLYKESDIIAGKKITSINEYDIKVSSQVGDEIFSLIELIKGNEDD